MKNFGKNASMSNGLWGITDLFYEKLIKKTSGYQRVRSGFQQLYFEDAEALSNRVEEFYKQGIKEVLLLAIILVLGISVVLVKDCKESKELKLTRGDYGEEEEQFTLGYENEGGRQQVKMDFALSPVEYTAQELQEAFVKAEMELEQDILGDNAGLEKIDGNLVLMDYLDEYGFYVEWISNDEELIDEQGNVYNEGLAAPREVELSGKLIYGEQEKAFILPLTIYPKVYTDKELEEREIREEIQQALERQKYTKEVILPVKVQGKRLYFPGRTGTKYIWITGFGISIILLLWLRNKEKLLLQVKEREKSLLRMYPGFVNELRLYMGAGVTLIQGIERVAKNHQQEDEALYGELAILLRELHAGGGIAMALEQWGRRTGCLCYMRLASIFIEQIKKGSFGVLTQLELEEQEAFVRRKEQAKIAGEEAGTKLLGPLIVLMVVSMVFVGAPAIISMMGTMP